MLGARCGAFMPLERRFDAIDAASRGRSPRRRRKVKRLDSLSGGESASNVRVAYRATKGGKFGQQRIESIGLDIDLPKPPSLTARDGARLIHGARAYTRASRGMELRCERSSVSLGRFARTWCLVFGSNSGCRGVVQRGGLTNACKRIHLQSFELE